MADEILYASSSVAGDADNPANATGTADGAFTTDLDNESWTHEWAMDDPTNSPTASQTATVDIYARKQDGTGTPTIDSVEVLNGAVQVGIDSAGWSVTSSTGATYSASITSSSWPSDGSDLRVKIVTSAAGGSPAARAAVQVDEIKLTLDTAVAAAAITPAAETVSVTPGGLTVTVGSVAITPAAETVSVSPGGLTVTKGAVAITPETTTVTATPGGLTVTVGSVAITPAVETVTVTPGGLTVTASGGEQNITPAATTVSVTPGGLTVTASDWPVTPEPVTISVTPGGMSLAAGAVSVVPDAVTVTATPGGLTVQLAQSIDMVGPTVSVSPGSAVLTVGDVAVVPAPVTVTVSAGSLVVTDAAGVDYSYRAAARHMESDAIMSFLSANETFTSGDIVGALNEINGTEGIEFRQAWDEYLSLIP